VCGECRAPAALPSVKLPPVTIKFEAGWAPELVSMLQRREKYIGMAWIAGTSGNKGCLDSVIFQILRCNTYGVL